MATIKEAVDKITRNADPQGNGFGVPADVSYSFWGGPFAFTDPQQKAAIAAMRLWEDVAQVHFFVDNADPEIGYKNFSDKAVKGSARTTAGGFNPDTTHELGFNQTSPFYSSNTYLSGTNSFRVMAHEIGHAIGLSHPGNYNADDAIQPTYEANKGYIEDSRQYSIMSYFGEDKTGASFNGQSARTPLLHDIAAAQKFYGANMTTRTENTIYGFNSNAGDTYKLSAAKEQAVFTIWDAGGTDTLDLSLYTQAQTIRLNPGEFSDTGGLKSNMSMADAVDIYGNNSWEANFDANNIGNYIENAIGGTGDDMIFGNAANNQLEGRDGKDTLNGLGGDDTMFGGMGDDIYVVDQEGDQVIDFNDELMGSGATRAPGFAARGGIDKVYTTLNTYDLGASNKGVNVENLQFTGSGNFTGKGNYLDNTIVGASGQDFLDGGAGNDILYGGAQHDVLLGGADNDTLNGEAGADTMRGGTGDDVYTVDDAFDEVIDSADVVFTDSVLGLATVIKGGIDKVYTSLTSYDLGAANKGLLVEELQYTGVGDFTGKGNSLNNVIVGGTGADTLDGLAGNDVLYGGANSDTLSGGADNDTLNGEAGADTMRGGTGDDVYIVDNYGDKVFDSADIVFTDRTLGLAMRIKGGIDKVYTTLGSYDLRAADKGTLVENLQFTGTGIFTGHGNALDNAIVGGGSADKLFGYAGNDWLDGTGGSDVMTGGTGNDVYVVDNYSDTIIETAGSWSFGPGGRIGNFVAGGNDTIRTSLESYHLVNLPEVENLTFTGYSTNWGTGNEAANILTGGIGIDHLSGGGGADTLLGGRDHDFLEGGAGNDTLIGDYGSDTFVMSGNVADLGADIIQGGSADGLIDNSGDLLDFSGLAGRVSVDLVAGRFTATGGLNSVTSVVHGIENVTGSAFADTLIGNAAANKLIGGAGADTLKGGGGEDILIADNEDTVVNGGDGYDYVRADASTAASGFHFNVAGSSIEYVDGSSGNDVFDAADTQSGSFAEINGNAGADTLTNGAGEEWFYGGEGIDTMIFTGNAADYAIASDPTWAGWTRITNTATQAYDYVVGVEKLQFADQTINDPSAHQYITATAGNRLVSGTDGMDVLVGSTGANDFLAGKGNDALYIDNQDGVIDGGEGWDVVYANESANQSGLVFTMAGTNTEYVVSGMGNDAIDLTGLENLPPPLLGYYGVETHAGDDGLLAGETSFLFAGGAGHDSLFLSGHREDYTFVETVTGNQEAASATITNTLTGVESYISSVETIWFQGSVSSYSDLFV